MAQLGLNLAPEKSKTGIAHAVLPRVDVPFSGAFDFSGRRNKGEYKKQGNSNTDSVGRFVRRIEHYDNTRQSNLGS